MPRPGPRPYDCVRRAWHSDRHQPMRGSLIKEIFRVADKIHSSSTKQNKEWQEKLPRVVLRAEEIMYSKANSEAEYMDLKTLWDRTNDAINTIIRRDESSETGDFLQPCIEAALNLGCTLRRASRSQRNCQPRCYLSLGTADLDTAIAQCSNLPRPPNHPRPASRSSLAQKLASAPENVPTTNYEKLLATSSFAAPKSAFSAYPLYYGKVPQTEPLCPGHVLPPKPVSDISEPAKERVVLNLPCHKDSPKRMESSVGDSRISCDLSLRLGPLSGTLPTPASSNDPVCSGQFRMLDNGLSFLWRGNGFESEATMRKRKACFDQPMRVEDQQHYLQPKLPYRNLTGL